MTPPVVTERDRERAHALVDALNDVRGDLASWRRLVELAAARVIAAAREDGQACGRIAGLRESEDIAWRVVDECNGAATAIRVALAIDRATAHTGKKGTAP